MNSKSNKTNPKKVDFKLIFLAVFFTSVFLLLSFILLSIDQDESISEASTVIINKTEVYYDYSDFELVEGEQVDITGIIKEQDTTKLYGANGSVLKLSSPEEFRENLTSQTDLLVHVQGTIQSDSTFRIQEIIKITDVPTFAQLEDRLSQTIDTNLCSSICSEADRLNCIRDYDLVRQIVLNTEADIKGISTKTLNIRLIVEGEERYLAQLDLETDESELISEAQISNELCLTDAQLSSGVQSSKVYVDELLLGK